MHPADNRQRAFVVILIAAVGVVGWIGLVTTRDPSRGRSSAGESYEAPWSTRGRIASYANRDARETVLVPAAPIEVTPPKEGTVDRPLEVTANPPTLDSSFPDASSEEAIWMREYANATGADMLQASASLQSEMSVQVMEATGRLYALGRFEVVESTMSSTDLAARRSDLDSYFVPADAGGKSHRVVLPKQEFPELYTHKRKIEWLREAAESAPSFEELRNQ